MEATHFARSGGSWRPYERGSLLPLNLALLVTILLAGCVKASDDDDSEKPVSATPVGQANISLSSYPSAIQSGGFATLSWKADNLNSCKGTGGWSGNKGTEGTAMVGPLSETTVFTLECESTATFAALSCKNPEDCKGRGPENRKKKSTTVIVDDQPPPPSPTVSLDAAPTSVASGASSTLTWWSTDADSCDASEGWFGARPISGNEDVGPLGSTTEFALTCSGTGGTAAQSVFVNVDAAPPPPVPTVSLTADPTFVPQNGSTMLVWTSTDADSCFAEDAWAGNKPTSGSETRSGLAASSTFTLTCTGTGGSASRSVNVMVQAQTGTADLSWVPPTSNEDGSPATLTAFNIYAGASASSLLKIATVNASQTTFSVTDLPAGTHYFAVTALSNTGESTFSNVESKVVP